MSGARRADKNIVVGPSAPPIIPIDAASSIPKFIPSDPVIKAPQKAINIPIWAAAPRSNVLGLAITGPKSVKAPIPRKIIGGNIFQKDNP